MSQQVNIYEAKTNLSALIAQAQEGHEVIIAKAGKPVAKLVAVTKPLKARKPGLWKGKVWMSEDFDAADKEIEDMFYNSEIFPSGK